MLIHLLVCFLGMLIGLSAGNQIAEGQEEKNWYKGILGVLLLITWLMYLVVK